MPYQSCTSATKLPFNVPLSVLSAFLCQKVAPSPSPKLSVISLICFLTSFYDIGGAVRCPSALIDLCHLASASFDYMKMSANVKEVPTVIVTSRPRATSRDSYATSLKTPRAARFAEATAVNSPIEPNNSSKYPYKSVQTNHYLPQPQPSDVDFGFMNDKHASQMTVEMEEIDGHLPHAAITPASPLMSPPLKSAMKTPGQAPRNFGNILSPTFTEDEALEKQEILTDKEQANDLVSSHSCTLRTNKTCADTYPAESQDQGANGQDAPPRCQLFLLADCPVNALNHIHNLQYNEILTATE